ncbi:MAG: hypothetical protein U5K54_23100 [Cytophagales bacterium]|nr:hypothetical protein [Cytophagales bacterium]
MPTAALEVSIGMAGLLSFTSIAGLAGVTGCALTTADVAFELMQPSLLFIII